MNRFSPNRDDALGSPFLRISRPIAACSRCRRAKIKCDGKLPACSACEKAGYAKSCASSTDKSADGNEKSYVACLESRIRELEEKIAFASAKTSSDIKYSSDSVKSTSQKDSLFTTHAAVDGKAARRRENADVNELVSDFGFLSINATTHDFEKAKTSMTFARLILAAASNEPLPDYGSFRLPSKLVTKALATYYIDNVLFLIPVFDEKTLLEVIEAIYQKNGQSINDSGYWLFYLVLAISSISQSRNNGDRFYIDAIICIKKALSFADRVLLPGCVSQIQALVLLVQFSMLDPAHFDSWILNGVACRAIIDLGFHQDPPKEEQNDQKLLERRRTLFYCVYSLDRSISMVHARSFSFTDDSTSVALPSLKPREYVTELKSDSSKVSMEQSLFLFKMRKIQSVWYQELFQSQKNHSTSPSTFIRKMCQEMQKWAQSIPKDLPDGVRDLFHLELYYSYVYCLAPSSRVKAVSTWGKNLMFEYSVRYVQKMMKICYAPPNCTFFTYHDALRVYFVGCQLVSILQEDQNSQFFSTTFPDIQVKDFYIPLQPLNIVDETNTERALTCINQIKEILKTFSYRWEGFRVLLSSFEDQVNLFEGSLSQEKKI